MRPGVQRLSDSTASRLHPKLHEGKDWVYVCPTVRTLPAGTQVFVQQVSGKGCTSQDDGVYLHRSDSLLQEPDQGSTHTSSLPRALRGRGTEAEPEKVAAGSVLPQRPQPPDSRAAAGPGESSLPLPRVSLKQAPSLQVA